jgi:hypothetical protein
METPSGSGAIFMLIEPMSIWADADAARERTNSRATRARAWHRKNEFIEKREKAGTRVVRVRVGQAIPFGGGGSGERG